jgi:hypothetical protein
MFQRYEIVLDYEKRLIFPPPFTLISYTYMIIRWFIRQIGRLFTKCLVCCRYCCMRHRQPSGDIKTSNLVSLATSLQNINTLKESTGAAMAPNLAQEKKDFEKKGMSSFKMSTNTFNYWRNMAQKYSLEAEKEVKEKAKQKAFETNLNKVREDLGTQKKSLQRLNDRVISLEKSIVQNQSYLEQIKNLLTQKSSKSGLLDRKKNNYVHILSRESPYLSTNIPRFFVYEKQVPWECPFDFYDPPFLSLSAESFKIDRIFIDEEPSGAKIREDITQIVQTMPVPLSAIPPPPLLPSTIIQSPTAFTGKTNIFFSADTTNEAFSSSSQSTSKADVSSDAQQQQQADQQTLPRTRKSSLQSIHQPKPNTFLWNAVTTIENPSTGKKITIDRSSWITRLDEKSGQAYPLKYSLDPAGLPRNPMGRTGLRGRGVLHRYGPNHEIMAIVTRWKKVKNKPIYVERRKLLEFIAVKDPLNNLTKIPGDKILGDESQYSVVSRTFMELVFEESDVERGANFSEDEMIAFFASFASATPIDFNKRSSVQPSPPSSYTAHTQQPPTPTAATNISAGSPYSITSSPSNRMADILNEVGFLGTMIYRGYIDDPRNTDNAWIEAEIWNFHYDKEDYFDKRIKNPASKWREVSSNVRINSNEIIADVLKEISEIHNAFYS